MIFFNVSALILFLLLSFSIVCNFLFFSRGTILRVATLYSKISFWEATLCLVDMGTVFLCLFILLLFYYYVLFSIDYYKSNKYLFNSVQ